MIAQAPSPEFTDVILPLLKTLGVPGAWLVVIAYTLRKIALWSMPHIVDLIKAHVARQENAAACQTRLTDSTIKIQGENHRILKDIYSKLPQMCQMRRNLSQTTIHSPNGDGN